VTVNETMSEPSWFKEVIDHTDQTETKLTEWDNPKRITT
jgi:hypothetical protein